MISLIRTLTVGIGIAPIQPPFGRSWTFTTGEEFHLAPKYFVKSIYTKLYLLSSVYADNINLYLTASLNKGGEPRSGGGIVEAF